MTTATTDRLLSDVVTVLTARGIPAQYYHSGGGIYTVHIEQEGLVWDLGVDGGEWGWDCTEPIVEGHLASGYLGWKDTAPVEVVADAIMLRVAQPLEVV